MIPGYKIFDVLAPIPAFRSISKRGQQPTPNVPPNRKHQPPNPNPLTSRQKVTYPQNLSLSLSLSTMAPKRTQASSTLSSKPSSTATNTTPQAPTTSSASPTARPPSSSSSSSPNQSAQEVLQNLWAHYLQTTPQRTKLIDVFMGFLVVVGGLQFLYCVIAGNYVRVIILSLSLSLSHLFMFVKLQERLRMIC